MFFWRIKDLLEGGGELFRAEAELASKRFQRMLVGSAVLVLSLLVVLAGLGLVVAGITIEIAQHRGWSQALMIVGGGLTLIWLAVWLITYMLRSSDDAGQPMASQAEADTPKQDAREAKAKMSEAATPGSGDKQESSSSESAMPKDMDDLKDKAIRFAVKNPLAVGSVALLTLSVIGPSRAIRLASRGAAAAGIIGTLIDAAKGSSDGGGGGKKPNPAPAPKPPRPGEATTPPPTPPPARPAAPGTAAPGAASPTNDHARTTPRQVNRQANRVEVKPRTHA